MNAIPVRPRTMNQYFLGLYILFLSILSATLLFGGVVFLLNNDVSGTPDYEELTGPFYIIIPAVMIISLFLSVFIPARKFEKFDAILSLSERLYTFRTTYIIKLVILEGAALLAIVVYLLTCQIMFLLMGGVMLLFMVFNYPNRENIEKLLKLSQADRETMADPNFKI